MFLAEIRGFSAVGNRARRLNAPGLRGRSFRFSLPRRGHLPFPVRPARGLAGNRFSTSVWTSLQWLLLHGSASNAWRGDGFRRWG